MDERQIKVAAFSKMVDGEVLSITDIQRVWEVVLNNGLRFDTGNQQVAGQFVSQLKNKLQQQFFAE